MVLRGSVNLKDTDASFSFDMWWRRGTFIMWTSFERVRRVDKQSRCDVNITFVKQAKKALLLLIQFIKSRPHELLTLLL